VSEPARIAVNASIVGDRPTGLGHYALHVVSALDALGEQLTVYTSRPDFVDAPHARLRRISAGVQPERGPLGHLRRLLWTQTMLWAYVRRDRPRLLLNLTSEGLLWSPVPQVTVVHDLLPLLFPAEYPRHQYYYRHFVPGVLRRSRAVIVPSESTGRDLVRFYPGVAPDRIHVVLLGYDARLFPLEAPAEVETGKEPYALYVGNVMPHKNLLRIVEAFAIAVGRGPGRLVIRGRGRAVHTRALRTRIDALGLASRVDWRPYADAAELGRLYQRARMLVLPSLYEGFGLTALEAMACGTPVLTANVSSMPEVVGDAALLVDPTDVGAIAGGMARLFTDDLLAKDLGERGRLRARGFSWDQTGKGVLDVIRRVAP
jgi:glycosyltransferase involved in cell wall biosynthesis